MGVWEVLLQIVLGIGVGGYGVVIGAGGGFLLVPALLLLHPEYSVVTVTTVSLAVVFLNTLSATLAHARQRRIDYVSGAIFVVSALPGSIAGAWLTRFVPRAAFDVAFGCLMLALAALLLWPRRTRARAEVPPGKLRRTVTDRSGHVYTYQYDPRLAATIGLAGGFVSSLAGIGGGVIIVPAMITLLDVPVAVATATSVFTILFSAAVGTTAHLIAGDFDFPPERILALGAGMILGGQLGVFLSARISNRVIIRLLALGVAFIGARLLAQHLFVL